ncbi:sulfite exporter TauE/SafE family protein [Desulfovibrio sp. JC022]|uniref:sulfite exporter TauE/SafE family protein n=1 Tax=Desulfovibrio sp. JC022 TaxID=2593642 RepID=UPI0013D099B2|nr:sulfite exporter TauE/SafE family protein [Desulfovibrio sp. JC022]NDV21581.1 TSUP family transporter [Desulfovibrio sp. JC022]
MKKPSGRLTFLLISAAFLLLCPLLLNAADIKIPEYLGRANNPYILPDENGPGFFQCTAIGLVTGMLSAVIGAGGGLLVVPALMTAGVSGIYAVGSELFRLFIFSTIQSIRMGVNRRIKYTLALIMTVGTTLGGVAGYALCKTIFIADPAGHDIFISSMIALWLIVYTFIIIPDFREAAGKYALELLRKEQEEKNETEAVNTQPEAPAEQSKSEDKKTEGQTEAASEDKKTETKQEKVPESEPEPEPQFEDELYPDEEPWEIASSMRSMKLPPYIKFPSTIKKEEDELEPAEMKRDGEEPDLDKEEDQDKTESIPILPIFFLTVVGGFFMAMTGSGGVILTFTVMTKGFGCVAALVAGTDLARLALSTGGLSMGTYGLNGFINIYCITGLVFGTISGLHLGSKALKNILPYRVKGLVALLVISVIINRLLAIPALLRKAGASIDPGLVSTFDSSGAYILLIGTGIFGCWMLFAFLSGIYKALQPVEDKEESK